MQWYGFYKEPPGGVDAPNGRHSLDFSFSILLSLVSFFMNPLQNGVHMLVTCP